MRIRLLGAFQVERAGELIPDSAWSRRSARALVKLLAADRRHRLAREEIQDRLWPDLASAPAYAAFRQALHAARHALEPDLPAKGKSAYVQTTADMIALANEVWIDADEFETLAGKALRAADVEAYEAALALYAGELLPEEPYADWVAERREALSALYLQVLLGLGAQLERRGMPVAAMDHLRRAIVKDICLEPAHRELMRLHAVTGRRHQALQQYQACRQALQRELGVEPELETQQLYEDILAGRITGKDGVEPPEPAGAPVPAVVRRLPRTPMVGRERALEILREELQRTAGGRGGLVLVSGEPGVGKTRLLAEFVRAVRTKTLVLWGTSYQQESLLPYGPFVEALEAYMRSRPESERATVVRRHPELAPLIPALRAVGGVSGHGVRTPDGMRTRLFSSIVRLFADLSSAHPVVLVLDDLHAADEASVQLLYHLTRAAQERLLLLVASYREDEVESGSGLDRFSLSVGREGLARQVSLLRLAREECEALSRSILPGAQLDTGTLSRLYELSLGNPLFLQELLAVLHVEGPTALAQMTWEAVSPAGRLVPRGVRQLVDERMSRLEGETRVTAGLAAVAGMGFSFELLRASGVLSDATLLDGLDGLLYSRILEERQSGYGFRHPLFRQALYEQLSLKRRASLHTALGAALEEMDQDNVAALAHHFARSHDRVRALKYLEEAGDQARSRHANEVAVTHYEEVLKRLDQRRELREVARVQAKLGAALTGLARYDDALTTLDSAIGHLNAIGDLEGMARAIATAGRALRERGTPQVGEERIRSLLPTIEPEGRLAVSPDAAADVYVALAHTCFAAGRYRESHAAAERANELARLAGNTWLISEAELRRGTGLRMLGNLSEARATYERAIPLAESSGNLYALALTLNNLASVHEVLGNMTSALQLRERCVELAESLGDPNLHAWALAMVASSSLWTGRLNEARASFERVRRLHQGNAWFWKLPYPLVGLGGTLIHLGEYEEARRVFSEALAIAERYDDLQALSYAIRGLAELELACGQPSAAYARLTSLRSKLGEYRVGLLEIAPVVAEAQIELGEWAEADAILADVLPRAEKENRMILVELLRIQGKLQSRQGRWPEADGALKRAVALAHTMPYPLAEGRTLVGLGELEGLHGNLAGARECFERAVAVLRPCGAKPYIEQAEALLAALPGRSRTSARAGSPGQSPRSGV